MMARRSDCSRIFGLVVEREPLRAMMERRAWRANRLVLWGGAVVLLIASVPIAAVTFMVTHRQWARSPNECEGNNLLG